MLEIVKHITHLTVFFSDHRIIFAILILSLRADKKTTVNKKRYNWCILTTDKTIRQNYAKYLKNISKTLSKLVKLQMKNI